ncbi:MAG: hypothetical protein KAG61_09595 [Bacteriovoracaceae bacterium]|nr:hypothetical protein [Bacteriovoracaceae bacterium]
MRHIFLIDPLEKLTLRKDSSLYLAMAFKERGLDTCILFANDFFYSNQGVKGLKAYDFDGELVKGSQYIDQFNLGSCKDIELNSGDTIHMRIDPPFDTVYLRYLWMLSSLKKQGVKVVNDPDGIVRFNEKLYAFAHPSSLPSFVGSAGEAAWAFCIELGDSEVILKPLDLYQGIGVEKYTLSGKESFIKKFDQKVKEYNGPVVLQSFYKKVVDGEIRTLYFKGKEIGTILKTPPKGSFLTNIASGGQYKVSELSDLQRIHCDEIAADLLKEGIDFIAFDVMGDHVSEVNITCPGLLVEVAEALNINLGQVIAESY